jgi:hypothetical protein
MKTKFNIHLWPQGEDTLRPDQISYASWHKEYANEGDEFVDDAIRTVDQPFDQIDGSFEVWQRRSEQVSNITHEVVNSKNKLT